MHGGRVKDGRELLGRCVEVGGVVAEDGLVRVQRLAVRRDGADHKVHSERQRNDQHRRGLHVPRILREHAHGCKDDQRRERDGGRELDMADKDDGTLQTPLFFTTKGGTTLVLTGLNVDVEGSR